MATKVPKKPAPRSKPVAPKRPVVTKGPAKTAKPAVAKRPEKPAKKNHAPPPDAPDSVSALTPELEPPPPTGPRRVVFIDVENTSSESELLRVLDELKIDLTAGSTEMAAIGNWRVVGQHLGRSLAQRGASLVHSAPAARVSDWSDLWIAVQAGIWLGRSRPGDFMEIVSHDRAFDAVGDAAARLGVTFRRVTYRAAGSGAQRIAESVERDGEAVRGGGRHRRGRGGVGRHPVRAPQAVAGQGWSSNARARPPRAPMAVPAPAVPASSLDWSADSVPASVPAEPTSGEARQGASQDQLRDTIARLTAAEPSHTITLDALTVALKNAGFQRPPGSPRLITRLRALPGIEVLPNSKLRMSGSGAGPSAEAAPGEPATPGERANRPPRRRGGRRRGGGGGGGRGPQAPVAPTT